MSTQARFAAFGFSTWHYTDAAAPHFHVCNGPRPGGHFIQKEAWPVRIMVLDHVCRVTERFAQEADR